MAVAQKIEDLTALAKGAPDDLLVVVDDPDVPGKITRKLGFGTFLRTYNRSAAEIVEGLSNDDLDFKNDFGHLLRYGENTVPGTTNMSAPFQSAVDSNDRIILPGEDILCENIITLKTNSNIFGAGMGATRIIKNADNLATQGVLFAESSSSSNFISNIAICDLTVDGLVATKSFSQFRHLISINGVKDVFIYRVEFLGYRGDGCYIGSGITGSDERHNINATIQHCIFDGVNSDNRNGVSVIDCDGLKLLHNTFRDTSKSTMPGPIDVEPDSDFNVIKNIEIIGNRIESYSGSQAIAITPVVVLATKLFAVTIKDNYIAGATKGGAVSILVQTVETISSAAAPMGVEISGNEVIDSESVNPLPFKISKIRDIKITNNTFSGGTIASLGDVNTADVTVYDAVVENNTFYQNGNATGALQIASVDNATINANTFDSPNEGTSTRAIRFFGSGVTTVSSNIQVTNNTFIKGASQTISIGVTSHTLTPGTNTSHGNQVVGGTLTDEFDTVATFASTDATPSVSGNDTFKTAGTTAITDFDDGYKGQTIRLLATDSITIIDGTPIILNGSVNFTMVSGDTLTLTMFDNQVWQEVARSVN